MTEKKLKINCDLGEISSQNDEAIMPYIHMCSIACGGHAGDQSSMKHWITKAAQYNLEIGVHPSYPDRPNFGRVSISISDADLFDSLTNQIRPFLQYCSSQQIPCSHIKAHGALYHDIHRDLDLFILFTEVLDQLGFHGKIIMADGYKSTRCKYDIIHEVFLDRAYESNKTLRSRNHPDAIIHDAKAIKSRLDHIINKSSITSIDGVIIDVNPDTLCIHSDTESSLMIAQVASEYLQLPN